MVTQFNRSDVCSFANYITDLIQKGELTKSDDGKYWATHDHFDQWIGERRDMAVEQSLISFGAYMISDERRKLYAKHPELGDTNLEERLSKINHCDVQNWMADHMK